MAECVKVNKVQKIGFYLLQIVLAELATAIYVIENGVYNIYRTNKFLFTYKLVPLKRHLQIP